MTTQILSQEVKGSTVTIRLQPAINLTDDQFYKLCQLNKDLRIERTAQGELVIMPPTGGETGDKSSELNMQLRIWAKQNKTGVAFDSSTGFDLPNGATRSPDTSWVKKSRLVNLTKAQKKKFIPLCPDFVVELRSPSDALSAVQDKMKEYIENGTELGWLIDPEDRRVYVYRPNREIKCLENPTTISGDPLLPEFVLDLREIWETDF
jgi:Uma2 family endonuclease